ncbi:penicillin-binding protein [Rhodospirillum rubrum]|uniref:peptidoglycan D,D-transpeptidase FtsI family protein n=1 Tax=Rhodospirillum rubrum TaxID=1085 RepID=UPI001907E977|nr:penicillin-binding protein 2 [Rhodospirillum rubrum]MBK1663969.1 penicillin-binding protein [Rhodospirillum rubrum]MBK1677537.1 penicillin-binding protein [Rhodospirillum rubrum]
MIALLKNRREKRFVYPGAEIRFDRAADRGRGADLEGVVHQGIETGRMRLMVAACLFGLAFSVIGGRLVQLMVLRGPGEPVAVVSAEDTPIETRMARADIVDRNGLVLATNLPTVNLYADTRAIPERDRLRAIAVLPTLFPELTVADLTSKMVPGRAFIYLRRNLTPSEQQSVNDLGIPGLHFERSERRVYPAGRLVAHVVGATDVDNNGIAGLEKAFESKLTSSDQPLRLSLDIRVQHAVHRALQDSIDHFQAIGGAALVMDVDTAEVVAMVSLPDYEPEKIGAASEDARFNRATLGVFEMGSTFKLFNTALALDAGLKLSDSFDARHPIRIARFTITDFHPEGRWLSIPEILMYSSNLGSARMAVAVGTDRQREFLGRMGLLDAIPFEIPEVGRPLVPNPWREINTMTISFGHGLSVTPLHLVTGVSALANGGLLRPPTLLLRSPETTPAGKQVLSAQNSTAMRALMRLVVEAGSGRNADVKGYYIGGKTGSAEKEGANGGYSKSAVRTSFVGVFPMTKPRYVVMAMLDDPKAVKGTYGYRTAGWNVTPTVGRMIAEVAPILGVQPVRGDPAVQFGPQLVQQVGLRFAEPEGGRGVSR